MRGVMLLLGVLAMVVGAFAYADPPAAGAPDVAALYLANCVACHGPVLRGRPGVPNLRDTVWYWGGSAEAIARTLRSGIRGPATETRAGVMPGFRTNAAEFTPADVADLADYVRHLGGRKVSKVVLERAELNWAWCTDCHAEDGSGKQDLGAPDLRDREWLHDGSKQTIARVIAEGSAEKCPPWGEALGDLAIRAIAADLAAGGGAADRTGAK